VAVHGWFFRRGKNQNTNHYATRLPLGDLKLEMPKSLTLRYFKTQGWAGHLFMNKFTRKNIAVLYLVKCLYLGCFGGDLYKILYFVSKFVDKTALCDLISKRSAHKPLVCHDKSRFYNLKFASKI